MHVIVAILTLLVSVTAMATVCPPEDSQHKYLQTPISFKNPSAGTYPLHYKLQNGFSPAKKTLILLHGGPGEGMASFDKCPGGYCFNEFSDEYNIVTVDERGAGCSRLPDSATDKFMTILATVEDIEVLRRSLVGTRGKISLFGVSFGTVVGMVYTSRHGRHVERMVLEGSVADNRYMLNTASDGNFMRMLAARPDINMAYQSVLMKIEHGELPIARGELKKFISMMSLYSYVGLWVRLPVILQQLDNGNTSLWDKIMAALNSSGVSDIPESQAYQYIMCRELFDVTFPPFQGPAEICKAFNDVNPLFQKYDSRDYAARVPIPVLLITGEWDGVVPASYNAFRMAQALPQAKAYEVPFAGHGVFAEHHACDLALIRSYFTSGLTSKLDDVFHSDLCQKKSEGRSVTRELFPFVGLGWITQSK